MRYWSPKSQKIVNELTPGLQRWVTRVRDEVCDISLICGFRDRTEQNTAFEEGYSQLQWPNGKHNRFPSNAVDLQPHPTPKDGVKLAAALGYIAGWGMIIAKEEGITLRWGGDWDRDGDLTDQKFDDLYHFEEIL